MTIRAIFFALLSLSFLSPAAHAAGGKFCLQTFNVYGPAYASGVRPRLAALAKELIQEPCESIQFQEFWQEKDYNYFYNQFGRAQMSMVRADALRRDKALTGLVSAFRGKVGRAYSEVYKINNEDGILDWFRGLSGVQKGFTAVEAELVGGPQLVYLNTHTHPTNEAIRLAQMLQLADFTLLRAEKAADLPLLFTADMNAVPGSPELLLLENVLLFRDAYAEAQGGYRDECTYCADNPLSWSSENRVIDFTLVRSSPTVEIRAARSEINLRGPSKDAPLSDHFGVRSQLIWQDRAAELLPSDSAEVTLRKSLAAQSLERARQVLVEARKDAFRPAIEQADALIAMFRSGRLPVNVERFYRTPR